MTIKSCLLSPQTFYFPSLRYVCMYVCIHWGKRSKNLCKLQLLGSVLIYSNFSNLLWMNFHVPIQRQLHLSPVPPFTFHLAHPFLFHQQFCFIIHHCHHNTHVVISPILTKTPWTIYLFIFLCSISLLPLWQTPWKSCLPPVASNSLSSFYTTVRLLPSPLHWNCQGHPCC